MHRSVILQYLDKLRVDFVCVIVILLYMQYLYGKKTSFVHRMLYINDPPLPLGVIEL